MDSTIRENKEVQEGRTGRLSGFWCRRNVASILCWLSAIWGVPALVISALLAALAGLTGFLGTPVDPGIDYDDHGAIVLTALAWLVIIVVLCFTLVMWLVGFLIGRSASKAERGSRVRLWGLVVLTALVIAQATLWFLSCRLIMGRFGLFLDWSVESLGHLGVWSMAIGVGALVLLAMSTGMAVLLAWETSRRRGACNAGAGTTEDPAVSRKSGLVALLLCVLLGAFGAHRFYAGKVGTGLGMMLLTVVGFVTFPFFGGLFLMMVCVWVLADLARIAAGKMRDIEGRQITEWQRRKDLAS